MYGSHHKFDSPFLELKIDMIEQFPVADSLHLLHLGLMKRLLFGWRDGTFRQSDTKWPARTTNEVSEYLRQCKMPVEFQRAVRGLDCLAHWKGTEYRTFLHYIGIVILKQHLTHEAYVHFLLLFCAVTICSSKAYFGMLSTAHAMLLQFIEVFAEIYGEHHINSNVHNLSHLVDDVKRFGELDSFSAYPFETMLGKIKSLIRSGNRPLPQVAKRLTEDLSCLHNFRDVHNEYPILSEKRNDSDEEYYGKIELEDFVLRTDKTNSWILTKSNEIASVSKIIRTEEDIQLSCYEVQNKANFFDIPVESRHFNVYRAYVHMDKEIKVKLRDVKCKMVCLPCSDSNVFLPLLHTKK